MNNPQAELLERAQEALNRGVGNISPILGTLLEDLIAELTRQDGVIERLGDYSKFDMETADEGSDYELGLSYAIAMGQYARDSRYPKK